MFVVIPYLSKDPSVFGIYSICISLGIFLNYADLGFLKSTKKYAAEFYARNDRTNEMKFLGFGSFILMIFTLLLTVVIFWFSYNPDLLIKELDSNRTFKIASDLLLILAIFTPVTIFKRLIEMIYEIRLNNFISRKIFLIGSLVTISSIFYFFGSDNYMIVEYFLFFKTVDLLVITACFFVAKRKYNYNFFKLFSCMKFNSIVYKHSYKLAYSGLFTMLAWIVFYELDQVFIGKFLGPEKVAIYAIAFSFSIIFRQIFGILYRPYVERANHLIGLNKENELKNLIKKVIMLTAPLTLIPTLAFSIVSEPLILSWVGNEYTESVNLALMLSLIFSFGFITYSADIYLLAKEEINKLYISAIIPPLIFWVGIFFFIADLGVLSFGIFKLIGSLAVLLFYIPILKKALNLKINFFIKKIIFPLIIPVLFLITTLFVIYDFFPLEKSKISFLIIVFITGCIVLLSLAITYFTSKETKTMVTKFLKK